MLSSSHLMYICINAYVVIGISQNNHLFNQKKYYFEWLMQQNLMQNYFLHGELQNGVSNIGWGFMKFLEGKLCNMKNNTLKLPSFNTYFSL